MKRICVYTLSLVFLLLFASPVLRPARAIESIFDIQGAGANPDHPQITGTNGDGVNLVLPMSKTKEFIASTIDQLLGPHNIVMQWIGELKPEGKYDIIRGPIMNLATQIQQASDLQLNPAYFQTKEIHDTTPKNLSMTSRVCVYNPVTGELVGNFVSKTTMESDITEWGTKTAEGAKRFESYTTQFQKIGTDYRTPFIVKIHKNAALPCGSKMDAQDLAQNPRPFVKGNTFGSGGDNVLGDTTETSGNNTGGGGNNVTDFVVDINKDMVKEITEIVKDPITGQKTEQTGYKATVTVPSQIIGTGQDYPAAGVFALTAGSDDSSPYDTTDYLTSDQKKES